MCECVLLRRVRTSCYLLAIYERYEREKWSRIVVLGGSVCVCVCVCVKGIRERERDEDDDGDRDRYVKRESE